MLARDDIGSIEAGKCADLAVWRTDGLELGGAEDRVAGLVLSAPHRVDRLLVGGEDVVRDFHLVRAEEDEIAREHRAGKPFCPLRTPPLPGTELCQFSDNSFTGAVDSRRVQNGRRDRRQPEKRDRFCRRSQAACRWQRRPHPLVGSR